MKSLGKYLILALLLAIMGAAVYLYNNRLAQNVNILLLGVDSSDKYTRHADTIMVMRFEVKKKKITFISIPRDTKVIYRGKARKINSVYVLNYNEGKYSKANIEMLKIAETVIKEKVSYYAQVDYGGVKNVVDYFGGVRLDIPLRMYYKDEADGLLIDFQAGPQTLDGAAAVKYLRFRKDLKADVGRMERQQKFMFILAAMIMKKLKTKDVINVYSSVATCLNTNFPPDKAVYLVSVFNENDLYGSSKIILPGEAVYEGRQAYWKPDSTKIAELFK
ncbi:MAG: LCP family protein [Candidatus Firestonebacteria bacterium]|nr:LCP family protein [Candidatus Firestonebacteria bacterium]